MPPQKELDPSASALSYFGSELRRLRERAGLSQTDLGRQAFCARSLVGMIENADRMPTRDFAERVDKILDGGGGLTRLWPLVNRTAYPSWFRPYVDLERAATAIRSYEVLVVDGLLQTEDYARAVLTASQQGSVEERVGARLERQRILRLEDAPRLWVVLEENVLRRPVGGPPVMRDQLAALIEAAKNPRVVIQVIPTAAGAHGAMLGPVTLLSFVEGPDVAYVEDYGDGHLIGTEEGVQKATLAYDLVRTDALSQEASVDFMTALLKEPSAWDRTPC